MHWNEIHYSVTFCHSPVKLSLCCNFYFAGWCSLFILSLPTGLLDICTCPLTSLVVLLRLNMTRRIKLAVPMKFKNCHLIGFVNQVCKGISVAQMVLVRTGCIWGEEVVGPYPKHSSSFCQNYLEQNILQEWKIHDMSCSSAHFLIKWSLCQFPCSASVSVFHLWEGRPLFINFLGFTQVLLFFRHQRQEDPIRKPVLPLTQGSKSCGIIWGLERCWVSHKALGWVIPSSPWHPQCCQGPPNLTILRMGTSTPSLIFSWFLLFEQNLQNWISKLTQSEWMDT